MRRVLQPGAASAATSVAVPRAPAASTRTRIRRSSSDFSTIPRETRPGADYAVDIPVTPQLNPYVDRLPDTMQAALAKRYAELFKVYVKHRDAIERVTFWGVADGDSWLNNWPMKGRTNYPLLFDRLGQPKPALIAVISTSNNRTNAEGV